uniref:trypsin n=1 Tax=Astyanax mexicanus TaxID=7994 RepID=A0A3B1KDI2_ASTMX
MRILLSLLLVLLLQQDGRAESPEEDAVPSGPVSKSGNKASASKSAPPAPVQQPSKIDPRDRLLQQCLEAKYTHLSCSKVFCPPWRRCISGHCQCKLPYQCPRVGDSACGLDKKSYLSYCHAQAVACRSNKAVFSHFGFNCKDAKGFEVQLHKLGDIEVVQVNTEIGKALVCADKTWNIAAANVACRHKTEYPRGAAATKKLKIDEIKNISLGLSQCMNVRCTGSELSLAECTLYKPRSVGNSEIAAVKCYTALEGQKCTDFTCVNSKCIQWKHICDGIDHCGDNSDEMCCKSCEKSFHCKSGVCIPYYALEDGIRDCLGGEDEVPGVKSSKSKSSAEEPPEKGTPAEEKPEEESPAEETPATGTPAEEKPEEGTPAVVKPEKGCPAEVKPAKGSSAEVKPEKEPERDFAPEVKPEKESPAEVKPTEGSPAEVKPEKGTFLSNPKEAIQLSRDFTESQLKCGIPNMEYVYRPEDNKKQKRRKRVVGGEEALPTQIQWQVAVQEDGSINCGGVYLGGCWVLTAAHCVRPKPQHFKIKFSLWKKHTKQQTSDIVPVKNIIIHEHYNSRTYQNDIALVQLEELNTEKECINPNPAVRSVCVPWSTLQFLPGDTCTISGWGRNKEGRSATVLKWANVSIIGDCKKYYKERLFDGMECAGDLAGSVDSCQGDSGGPLVCTDASGLSYVWGIVSWGEKCGEANYPGVYTKVAYFFEWIRFHTGWPAVTKYNH